jgi:hypothetical protein
MSRFYSVNPRTRNAILKTRSAPVADAHSPSSKDYAERHIAYETQLPNGIVRVDMGEPMSRLPNETQSVPKGKPRTAPIVVAAAPVAAPSVPPAVPAGPLKGHRAITRNP